MPDFASSSRRVYSSFRWLPPLQGDFISELGASSNWRVFGQRGSLQNPSKSRLRSDSDKHATTGKLRRLDRM